MNSKIIPKTCAPNSNRGSPLDFGEMPILGSVFSIRARGARAQGPDQMETSKCCRHSLICTLKFYNHLNVKLWLLESVDLRQHNLQLDYQGKGEFMPSSGHFYIIFKEFGVGTW